MQFFFFLISCYLLIFITLFVVSFFFCTLELDDVYEMIFLPRFQYQIFCNSRHSNCIRFICFFPRFSYVLSVCRDTSGERREGVFGTQRRNSSEYGSGNVLQRLCEHFRHYIFCSVFLMFEDSAT